MGSEIYSWFWISARHCGMETNQHRWKKLHFFPENQSKLLVSLLLSTAVNTVKSLVYLFKNRIFFPLEFSYFSLMPLQISQFDVNFFSLCFKSKCRKEKSVPEDDLLHIDKSLFFRSQFVPCRCMGCIFAWGCQGLCLRFKSFKIVIVKKMTWTTWFPVLNGSYFSLACEGKLCIHSTVLGQKRVQTLSNKSGNEDTGISLEVSCAHISDCLFGCSLG